MGWWGDEVDFADVDAGLSIAGFAEGLHLIPEFADGSGDVFGSGVADPREDLDEAGVAGSVVRAGDEVGLGEDEAFLAIEGPNVGEDVLKLGFCAGLDVVSDHHGFGGRFGVVGIALVKTGGGAGGDEGEECEGDGDMDWSHWVMLRRLTEGGRGRKPEGGRQPMCRCGVVDVIKTGWGNAPLRSR